MADNISVLKLDDILFLTALISAAERSIEMNKLQETVNVVLESKKQMLSPKEYATLVRYLNAIVDLADSIGISEPCQTLYDSCMAKAITQELRRRFFRAIRLIDKEAKTIAVTPEGTLYNRLELMSIEDYGQLFQETSYPVPENQIDIIYLILKAKNELEHSQLAPPTISMYTHVWHEFYVFLHFRNDTKFSREACNLFVKDAAQKQQQGKLSDRELRKRRRAIYILLEVADTGSFDWKFYISKDISFSEESLENLRQQYMSFLKTQNYASQTIALYDCAFRQMLEGLEVKNTKELSLTTPGQIQRMLASISGKLSPCTRNFKFRTFRSILSYLYSEGYIPTDFSGMVLTPAYQCNHLKPYINASNEEKLYQAMSESPLRNKAMMLLALRLGLRDKDICNLRFSQIDWKNDKIVLTQKKTGNILYLPLLEDVGNAIMDYIINERPKDIGVYDYVFVSTNKPYRKIVTMYYVCSGLLDKANIDVENSKSRGSHVCRYTLTHKLLMQKTPHQIITDALGHTSKESDKPYISMEEQMLRKCPLDFSLIGQKYWKEGDFND